MAGSKYLSCILVIKVKALERMKKDAKYIAKSLFLFFSRYAKAMPMQIKNSIVPTFYRTI